MIKKTLACFTMLFLASQVTVAGQPAEIKIIDQWSVEVTVPAEGDRKKIQSVVTIDPLHIVNVVKEEYDSLPEFNPHTAGYAQGVGLTGVRNEELTTRNLLLANTLKVRGTGPNSDIEYERGVDYEIEPTWGVIGRLPNGAIHADQSVLINYQHGLLRLDSIVLSANDEIEYRAGEPKTCLNHAPTLRDGETRLANIWLQGTPNHLTENDLFPISETSYPTPPQTQPSIAEKQIPKTFTKLKNGEHVKILAWGDSVTDARYLPDYNHTRWQEQFVTRLRKLYPNSNIELVTEAWGGRTTGAYLGVPPGEEHNYQETVLAVKPDLIISEFVNDAHLSQAETVARYEQLLNDFQKIGAEWIVLTPHYVRPDWMNLDKERDIDDDPRPYVAGLREFGKKNNIAIGEGSMHYGRLWRQGIPYTSLFTNVINHPDERGMKLFADALLELFPTP